MKYCRYCGAEMFDEAVICVKCGRQTETVNAVAVQRSNENDTMHTIIKVFLILGCVSQGWLLLPLAWCIPITVSIFKAIREKRPISTGMKICTLLFVNLIAGICLLCLKDDNTI